MTTEQMITELRKKGHKVNARKRKDGGMLIKSIDGRKFTGAKGNAEARRLLGVTLSEKRKAQTSYNVESFIKEKKKIKTLEDKVKKRLRQVQRKWRKHNVQGELNAPNTKKYLKEYGYEATMAHLRRMERYGEGFAYEKNVEYLAQYIEDIADSIQDEETKIQVRNCAGIVREYKEFFRDEWIPKIYSLWYTVRNAGFDKVIAKGAIRETYETMKG